MGVGMLSALLDSLRLSVFDWKQVQLNFNA